MDDDEQLRFERCGLCLLVFCVGVLALGKYWMGFGADSLQTLSFVALAFGSQAMIYALRERGRMWDSRPSNWVVASSVAEVLIASALAVTGLAMAPLPAVVVAGALAAAVALAFVLDVVKRPVFAKLHIV